MAKEISKSQIDKLGERLKLGKTEDDLRLLEQYRHSFRAAHEFVYKEIREKLSLEPTKRRTKTIQSIVDKLRRGSIKLTQIQDIAGCRIVTKDIANQDNTIDQLKILFNNHKIKDRREKPSHGYRAVHVMVLVNGKVVEIQVRTELQDLWAELSEKYADAFGQMIKYGQGNHFIQQHLIKASSLVSEIEFAEYHFNLGQEAHSESRNPSAEYVSLWPSKDIYNAETNSLRELIDSARTNFELSKNLLARMLREGVDNLIRFKEKS